MNLIFVICATNFALLQLLITGIHGSSRYDSECNEWNNLTDYVESHHLWEDNAKCNVHPSCTGFECIGKLKGLSQVPVQLGMSILPCTNPLKFELNLVIGGYPYNLTLNIKKEPVEEILPLSEALRPFHLPSNADANLTVYLASSQSDVTIGVKLKSSLLPTGETIVIPRTTVPYPACVSAPTIYGEPSTQASTVRTDVPGGTCSFKSLDKPCSGINQMCMDSQGSSGSSGKCVCKPGFYWDANARQCLTINPTDSPASHKPPDIIGIIVGATITGAVLIAALLIVILYKYRRYRERYGQHTLLVNNENDTELDDPDPPMLNG